MAKAQKQIVTKEYFDELNNEYRRLIDVERPQVLEELKVARAQGDLSENADYDAARNKQAEIEARIRDLEFIISNSEVATAKASKNKITSTSKVVVFDKQDNCEYLYQLVGSMGGNPEEGKITTESSLGASLLGKEVGDEVEIFCPDGSSYIVVVKEIK